MDRVALDLGFIQIYWYSICILLGILVGCFFSYREVKKHNINEDFFINLIFYGIIFALIGARAYFVLFNLDYYLKSPLEIFEIWNGGLAIHGGIIAGLLWFIIYTKKYKQKTLKLLDITVIGLIIGQAIGRWGNFFNQEVYGMITTKEALEKAGFPEFIVNQMNIEGFYRQPLFFYESIWNLFGFIALLIVKRYKYLKTGQLTGIYLMWYSLGRFFIEGMRDNEFVLQLATLSIAQLVSIAMFIIGLVLLLFRKKGSRFQGLYQEKEENNVRF